MSDITVATLVQRAQRWLIGMHGRPLNRLNVAVDDTITEFECSETLNVLSAGTYVGIDDEIVYVWEIDQGNKRLTVSRGQLGTEAAEHVEGAMIESNSRFPRGAIKDAIQEEIRAWPDTVFQVKSRIFNLPAGASTLDVGYTDRKILSVLAVNREPQTVFRDADKWTPMSYRVDRLMSRESFGSGTAVTLTERVHETRLVQVLVAVPFNVDEMDDDVHAIDDIGLLPSMCDIPPAGAAARLLHTRELVRTDTEASQESRLATEVPATYQAQTATTLRLWCARRLGEEALRLRSRYRISS